MVRLRQNVTDTTVAPRLPPQSATSQRQSEEGVARLAETPMHDEYTPATSLYEDAAYLDDDDDDNDPNLTALRVAMRAVNAVLHFVACLLLLIIMAVFLERAERRGRWYQHTEPQAVTLIALLSFDILLDQYTIWRIACDHPGWALLVRLALGIGYLALFMVYVGMGSVFPRRYAFWGLTPGFSGPVVYLFLWMIGVWNLLNTALHRHRFGRTLGAYGSVVRRRWQSVQRRQPTSSTPGAQAAAAPFWQRWFGRRQQGSTEQRPRSPPPLPPPPPPQQQRRQRRQQPPDVEQGDTRVVALQTETIALHERLSDTKHDDTTSTTTATTITHSNSAESAALTTPQTQPITRPPVTAVGVASRT
ncbi:hypothetical protein SPI_06298 [Niveomyces insectorum RCEF 264]|uniref:Uncharacterized protein n=1 Tax=Niveomyces insectorum RCEF 264 TaxID=1081102 RepID=A0A167RZU3_9HYPO|nr:hypothetical protein SPI_06298 [Niveomyces insectorum RCEF 264]